MKRIIFIITYLTVIFILFAQKELRIEHAILEIHYSHTMHKDTLRRSKVVTDSMILRIGKNSSQFFSYYVFMEDSLFNDPNGRKIAEDLKIKAFETNDFSSFIGLHTTDEFIYKNYPQNL